MNYVNSYDTYTYRTVQYIITTNKSSVKVIHYATTSKKRKRKTYLQWDWRLLLRPTLVAIVGATQNKK